jgi:aminoglycoside phosphotransferase (APT) family kinase protein
VTAVLHEQPSAIERVPCFAGNRVYRAEAGGGVRFFKFGPRADIARELEALQVVVRNRVPVPAVEAVDLDGRWSPHALVVLAEVDGEPLRGSEADLPRLGELMDRWHAVALDGFGTAVADEHGRLRGEHRTWPEALEARVSAARPAAAAGLVRTDLVDRATEALHRARRRLEVDDGRLLHGDFHPRHVYAHDQRITAVIDWGDATVGDPDYDRARLLHVGMLDDDQSIEPRTFTKLLLYAAVFACWSMAGELQGGAPWQPWWPAQSARLAILLDALDAARSGNIG